MTLSPNDPFANRYIVDRFLGQGSYGQVYAAVDTHQDGRDVALKLLDPSQLDDWDWGEASLLTRLQSQYVLSIYNADVWDGVPYLATELATQGSLDDAEELPRLWVPDVLKAVGCAARGLARVHDDGIVHRDVKPANIFWAANGSVMVGDFGLAHPLDANGEAPPHGTPATLAPEVADGNNSSVMSDIWSLGATAYRLLTGVYPHEDVSTGEMAPFAARCTVGPTRIRDLAPHVSRGVAASIEKALALDPAHRHASMTAFDSSLSAQAVPRRIWREKIPDDGHLNCWESKEPNSLRVCRKPGESSARVDLETTRSSGRRIKKNCSAGHYKRTAAGRLKSIFDDLGT